MNVNVKTELSDIDSHVILSSLLESRFEKLETQRSTLGYRLHFPPGKEQNTPPYFPVSSYIWIIIHHSVYFKASTYCPCPLGYVQVSVMSREEIGDLVRRELEVRSDGHTILAHVCLSVVALQRCSHDLLCRQYVKPCTHK